MTDPVTQAGDAVTITTAPLLASVYQATLAHIARRRRDGLPAADLRQLAQALRRAHDAAVMSPPRHNNAVQHPVESPLAGQDGAFLGSAAAAVLLGRTQRSIQRLAAANPELLGARRHGSIWLLERRAVQALADERKVTK